MKEQNVAMQQLQQAERLMMKSMQSAWEGQRTGNTPADVQSRINSAFDSGIVPGTGTASALHSAVTACLPDIRCLCLCLLLSLLLCLPFATCLPAIRCCLSACLLLPNVSEYLLLSVPIGVACPRTQVKCPSLRSLPHSCLSHCCLLH